MFQKVLHGIFGHYPKPPLGEPPPYAKSATARIGNLNRVDSLLLESACQMAIEQGNTMIDDEPWLARVNHLALTTQQISDSQRMLEECGFIELYKTIGPGDIYAFSITLHGFNEFAKVGIPDFDDIALQVAATLAREEHTTGDGIAQVLNQPLRVVEHILELLENHNLIKIIRQHGGAYMSVWEVSTKLRRAVSDES